MVKDAILAGIGTVMLVNLAGIPEGNRLMLFVTRFIPDSDLAACSVVAAALMLWAPAFHHLIRGSR